MYDVAKGSNRLNSSGDFSAQSWRGKSSFQFVDQVLLAGETYPASIAGNRFYVIETTGSLNIRPDGGSFVTYSNGQGLHVPRENAWGKIEILNNTVSAITFTLVVGFDEFIDNTVSLNPASIAAIAAAIISTAGVAYGPVDNSANNAVGALGNFRSFSITLWSGTISFPGSAQVYAVGTVFEWPNTGTVFPSPAFDASGGVCVLIGVR